MKKYYSKKYFKDRDHLDFHIAESIKILVQDNNLKDIIDVGCGTGKIAKHLNDSNINTLGCDISKEAVLIAKKINNFNKLLQASAFKLPLKNQSFDLVISISTIEHFNEDEAKLFIAEANRVLKPPGFIFLITPNFNSPLRYIQKDEWFGYSDPTHKHFFTPKSLSILLKQHGFKNISLRPKSAYNVLTDLHLPSFLRSLPTWGKNICNYLMVSSPLSTMRDSFWIVAQKK